VTEERFGTVRSEVQILSPRLILAQELFGRKVGGLSHFMDETYAERFLDQTDDFENLSLRSVRRWRKMPDSDLRYRYSSMGCYGSTNRTAMQEQ
jgi:hypothetical protein